MVKTILRVLVLLPAILFLVIGMRWLVDPGSISLVFGFELADGLGRSSQVGDMFSYFLTLSLCMLMALTTGRRLWYYPPIMLLLLTCAARIVAWVVHDASLALQMIGVEIIVGAILLTASRYLPNED